jgi:hypothetical protein
LGLLFAKSALTTTGGLVREDFTETSMFIQLLAEESYYLRLHRGVEDFVLREKKISEAGTRIIYGEIACNSLFKKQKIIFIKFSMRHIYTVL